MAQRSGVISLQSFLKKYFDKKNVDQDEYVRYHVILADGLRELSIHHLPSTRVTTLTIDATNLTCDFPTDFIDYVYIAIEEDGRYWKFTRDDNMVDKTISGITGTDLGDYITTVGPGAVGGENKFWFKPDYENRRFLFNGFIPANHTVIMSYKSTGVESVEYASTVDIEFPVYGEAALEAYLHWKVCEYDDGHPAECDRRRKMYIEEVRMLRNLQSLSVQEIRDIWNGSSNQTLNY